MFARLAQRPMPVWRAFVAEAPQWYGLGAVHAGDRRAGRRFPLRRPVRVAQRVRPRARPASEPDSSSRWRTPSSTRWIRPSRATLLASTINWFLSALPATTLAYFAIIGVELRARVARRALRERERQRGRARGAAPRGATRRAPHAAPAALSVQQPQRDHGARARPGDCASRPRAVAAQRRASRHGQRRRRARDDAVAGARLRLAAISRSSACGSATDCASRWTFPTSLRRRARPDIRAAAVRREFSQARRAARPRRATRSPFGARAADGGLTLTVRTTAAAADRPARPAPGVGIANARARLERMYGASASALGAQCRRRAGRGGRDLAAAANARRSAA